MSELKGKRVRVVVHKTPCRITMDGVIPLERTTWATVMGAKKWPAGYVMFVRDDGGNVIGIDEHDIAGKRVEIELHAADAAA